MTTGWHALGVAETLEAVGSDPRGLDAGEVTRRLALHGPNALPRAEPVSALRILLDQFASVVVLLLLAAAVVSFALGDVLESAAIAVVLLINTSIGFGVELRARRVMDALLRFEVPAARVVREGSAQVVRADGLVPGDVIRVEEGDTVPADARLLEASELRTAEAPLTGESIPVDKSVEPVPGDTVLAERTPMIYAGTPVTRGRASAVVVATGARTEMGRIGTLVVEVEASRTPLEERLDVLGRRLVWATLGIAGLVIALGVLRGAPIGLMVETGIALAIAAVPEGLPAVATIALAVGLRRMARRQALVRRLMAVEALGATTVVCTDKTGTLTAGQMTVAAVAHVARVVAVRGEGYADEGEFVDGDRRVDPTVDPWLRRLLEACALTTRASFAEDGHPVGDPTDAALLVLARKGGQHPADIEARLPREAELPFSSERLTSASIHRGPEGSLFFVKGSPETMLARAEWHATADGDAPLDESSRAALIDRNEELARAGLRVIALGSGAGDPHGPITLLGLAGIVDPAAPGVKETIATLTRAGIRTVMVTGDQARTARAIAVSLGAATESDPDLDGRALAALDDAELIDRAGEVAVFSRVSPEQKVRIVSALQERGEVVAMIGDGVNDAAALKKADIGVAMGGRGTDVAKETAAIVLGDDRFATIAAAVEEGRVIYENIRKFVFYLFSCNVAEVLVLLGASLAGTPVPLLPLQILWLNLVTDTFPALALALEPAEPGVMRRPPRLPHAPILSRRFVATVGLYALAITGVTLAAYAWGLSTGEPARASTIAFMTLALAQLFHLGNARGRRPVLSLARVVANRWAVAAFPLVLSLQVASVTWAPLTSLLRTTPLSAGEWAVVVVLSGVPAVLGQATEVLQQRRDRATRAAA